MGPNEKNEKRKTQNEKPESKNEYPGLYGKISIIQGNK
jgi:hypothetical protein